MNILPSPPPSQESALAGRRLAGLVVDIGLSCPSCRVQLTLPSALLGQMVTGPCPVCGLTLVFCHGRIESAPVSAADAEVGDRGASTGRSKLPRSGTPGVPYLEEVVVAGAAASAGSRLRCVVAFDAAGWGARVRAPMMLIHTVAAGGGSRRGGSSRPRLGTGPPAS